MPVSVTSDSIAYHVTRDGVPVSSIHKSFLQKATVPVDDNLIQFIFEEMQKNPKNIMEFYIQLGLYGNVKSIEHLVNEAYNESLRALIEDAHASVAANSAASETPSP